ncbi:RCC1 domain-containing protein [Hominifimenecus microfluidus]|uniref:RCC1 domain-containing protein n=1 Tax=Hominifimenecus microfluidus TaxID=2885348 RepID=UPI0032C03BEB
MYICPVCGKKNKTENGICTSCRFDRSRNYEAYATISPLKGKNNHAISKKKQDYESKQRPGAFACSKCKSIRFHIFPETNKILCVDCGMEIRQDELPWKQPEYKANTPVPNPVSPAISTSAPQSALTISPFALQKFPFVSVQFLAYAAAIKENGEITYTDQSNKEEFNQWKNIKALAGDSVHTVALKSDGTVSAIGNNEDGQCDVFSWKNIAAITTGIASIGYDAKMSSARYTLALRNDGTIVATKGIPCRDEIQQWKDIVSVAVSRRILVGLKVDGTVVAAGNNQIDQLDVTNWKNIKKIACGFVHAVGLTGDGTIVTAVSDLPGNSGRKTLCNAFEVEWKNIVSISCGDVHTVGLRTDGTVVATGRNNYNQCDTSSWRDIIDISCARNTTIGLKKDGTIITTGESRGIFGHKDLSTWHDIIAIECRRDHLIGLKADGTVCVSGCDDLSGVRIPDIYNRRENHSL